MHNLLQKYQVIGNPIAHSLSPFIHEYFASQAKINLIYEKQLINSENNYFEEYIKDFFIHKENTLKNTLNKGLNITLPFKERAYKLANHVSEAAKFAKASNTLYYKNNAIYADNTDGFGLVRDITIRQNIDLTSKNILLLGAGGASKGVLLNLLLQNPNSLTIANRSLDKAWQLIQLAKTDNRFNNIVLNAYSLEQLKLDNSNLFNINKFDIIINATSMGMDNQEYNFIIHKYYIHDKTFAYDMIYNKSSPFLSWAKHQNLKYCDGLGMLIEQAAYAFNIWHDYMPDTDELYVILKNQLDSQ